MTPTRIRKAFEACSDGDITQFVTYHDNTSKICDVTVDGVVNNDKLRKHLNTHGLRIHATSHDEDGTTFYVRR